MRITFVLDTFAGGGKERRCLQLLQGLVSTKMYDIQVIIVNDGIDYPELYDIYAQIIVIDRKNKGKSILQVYREIHNHLKAFRPDILQVWGLFSAMFTTILKPFIKCKYVVSYVADADKPAGMVACLSNWMGNRMADLVIGNSKAGIDAYNAPSGKSVVIYNGFNESRYSRKVNKEQKRQELGIDTKYMVAMVASFWENKDYPTYISAAKSILEMRNDITFLAVGKGVLLEKIKAMVSEGESKYIKFTGFRNDVDEILAATDVSVLCSNHNEGISNTILESMAWGVPVLATATGGTPEIIENGQNGILLPQSNPDHLASQLHNLLNDTDMRLQMGKNAKQLVKEKFSLSRMIGDYIRQYDKLMEVRRQS